MNLEMPSPTHPRDLGSAVDELDPAFCWQAVYSRDKRFDGRFFGGILTSGLYCRPTCPASFGRPEHVRWFGSAAAAEAAGFRPCRRCRPEIAPTSPAWTGTSAVVSRALKLLSDGVLQHNTVEELAARVGIGARHLRRLFKTHVGAAPITVARMHRVQVARNLIEATDLPITEVALCTGFGSVRQFNSDIRRTFGHPPTALRRLWAHKRHSCTEMGLLLTLPYRPPFDWAGCVDFLRPRITPGVETIDDRTYRRSIKVGQAVGTIEISPSADLPQLDMRVRLPRYDGLMSIVERSRRMFDLGADPIQILRRLETQEWLRGRCAARPGVRVPGAWDALEVVVHAALGQTLERLDSSVLVQRIIETWGTPIEQAVDGISHLFPTAEVLAKAALEAVGLSPKQAGVIRAFAEMARRGFSSHSYRDLASLDEKIRSIPGLDYEAAGYIAMRGFGEPDAAYMCALVEKEVTAMPSVTGDCTAGHALQHLDECRPWRAYALMLLTKT